ncbi:MAG: class I SAM-dependent methyltransferase [Patescibacteria group bacterium]|nr:class I SAM-dependent methyltransferase [Patescibacteria group bacterium]
MKELYKPESDFSAKERRAYEGTTITDRSLASYREYLGLPIEDLKGKLVLDIGSGHSGRFIREADKEGINVVAFNPELKSGLAIEGLNKRELPGVLDKGKIGKINAVAGIVQEMPFKDNSFDAEVALFSVPHYMPKYKSEYKLMFNEILRTLKPGGQAFIFPMNEPGNNFFSKKIFKDFLKELSSRAIIDTKSVEEYLNLDRLTLTKK